MGEPKSGDYLRAEVTWSGIAEIPLGERNFYFDEDKRRFIYKGNAGFYITENNIFRPSDSGISIKLISFISKDKEYPFYTE